MASKKPAKAPQIQARTRWTPNHDGVVTKESKAASRVQQHLIEGYAGGIAGLALLGLGPAFDLADPVLGVLGERAEHGIEGRLLGGLFAAVGF